MRLIDADALIAKLKDDINHADDGIVILYTQVEINYIEHAPTVDAVEIVRCQDCKHNPKDAWFGCPMSHLSEKQRPDTAWCWKGERKDG